MIMIMIIIIIIIMIINLWLIQLPREPHRSNRLL